MKFKFAFLNFFLAAAFALPLAFDFALGSGWVGSRKLGEEPKVEAGAAADIVAEAAGAELDPCVSPESLLIRLGPPCVESVSSGGAD